jgi:bidirectional [NiFe] hydrogenase diaphorase subunit
MVTFTINGLDVSVEEGTTLLEAAKFYGLEIPTLCHNDNLSPYGACRLCLVEIGRHPRSRLVSSCTYRATEGLEVRTNSERVLKVRRMLIEMYLATCPSSKVIQDLASKYHVTKVRFRQKHEDCILCGLCIRMCEEQMQCGAIGYVNRGDQRKITTFFDKKSAECRFCGGCMYICPACQGRCQGPDAKEAVCNACVNLSPPCMDHFSDMMCYMDPCVACEENSGRPVKKL